MKRKVTLDLHGVKHSEVEDRLIDFYFWKGQDPKDTLIITGNSSVMQKIVTEWLEENELDYYIPSYNSGEIQIIG
jgi:DNA-nicking Smr family endonuclease